MSNGVKTTEEFAGQVVADIAAAKSGVLTNIGHKLGLYKAMAGAGRVSSVQLAEKTSLHERYVREWLANQAAGGYVHYYKEDATFELPKSHEPVLVDDESPMFLVSALEVTASLWLDEDKFMEIFRTGEGMSWGAHNHRLFCGTESLFRPGYKTFLVDAWLAAIEGLTSKLNAGAKVADIGCGHGASTIFMAQAFPKSTFYGYDFHGESIVTAHARAQDAGASANLVFAEATAKSYSEGEFDLICFMDCLHDMGDPVGAAKHARAALKDDGVVMLVEPAAGDCVSENLNPVSRLYYAASTTVCTPCSRSQEVKTALGAQAGPRRLSSVMKEAGFNTVEKVAETPFNIVLAARP